MGVDNSAFPHLLRSPFQEAISLIQQVIVMQNRPTTGRPWFRSASLPQSEPPPTTQPTEPTTRPFLRAPSIPPPPPSTQSQPWRTVPPPPNQSQMPPLKQETSPPQPEAAPAPKPATPPPSLPAPSVPQTPPQSPKVIKASFPTPPPSPKAVPPLPSLLQPDPRPSPQPVPSPEPEIKSSLLVTQGKDIFTQHYTNGNDNKKQDTDSNNHKSANNSSSSSSNGVAFKPNVEENSEATSSLKKKSTKPGDENGTRWGIVTIAGENIGAFMEIGSHHRNQEKKQQDGRHFKHLHGTKVEEHGHEGDGSYSSNNKERGKVEASPSTGRQISALVNSNVQPINNSMVFNSSCIHRDPGVHITLSRRRQPTPTSSNHVHKDQRHLSAK